MPPRRPEGGAPSSFTVNPEAKAEDKSGGEYRYVPPYAGVGANTARPTPPPPPQHFQAPAKPKKEKVKTVRTFSTTALIFLLIGAVIISFAAGMLGALFVEGGFALNDKSQKDDTAAGDLVIDRAEEETDSEMGESNDLSGTLEGSSDC